MGTYDKSSKWLIQHHGDSILRLAGFTSVEEWRPLQAELVQPTQLPDGLLEAQLSGRESPNLFVVEIGTYPENRLYDQLTRDALLVFLDRMVVPEVVVLILHPKGNLQISDFAEFESELGLASLRLRWRVVELWKLDAEELLATNDPGLMPWVSLTEFTDPPEEVLRRCRQTIDQEAKPAEQTNLLAVSQVLAKLRFDDVNILNLFGGKQVMIESPLIQELVDEAVLSQKQKDILQILKVRFGDVPAEVSAKVEAKRALDELEPLFDASATAPSLDAFKERLS
ncbi:MAG: hypothetical protein QGG53_26895 [Planctomycetota bacterium]|jgi:hypothetical protein|nr:hypothetical protein [Planctomycetota bacterium]